MEKMIVVGNDIFDEFIKGDVYYIYKTELIYELVARTRNKVTFFTRPRRFGKTLAISIMESFFDTQRDSKEMFEGRKIAENHPEFCVIRGILSISMKTNEYLKFAVVTGCLRISKESIFTGVNNFVCYSVTSRKFSQYFGFTQEEVSCMLHAFGISDKMELIRKWYDGYISGNTEVFCPWDVANYLSEVMDDEQANLDNHWAASSSNAILNDFVNHSKIDVSEKFERDRLGVSEKKFAE